MHHIPGDRRGQVPVLLIINNQADRENPSNRNVRIRTAIVRLRLQLIELIFRQLYLLRLQVFFQVLYARSSGDQQIVRRMI